MEFRSDFGGFSKSNQEVGKERTSTELLGFELRTLLLLGR
jgi:hypothetical protein